MLYDALTHWIDSADYPTTVATGAVLEGVGLISVTSTTGYTQVAVGSASNNDHFAGVAISRRTPITTYPRVDTVVMTTAASGVVTATLTRTPLAPSTAVLVKTAGGTVIPTWQATAGSVASGEYNINTTTNVLTLNYANASGATVSVTYQYNLTAAEALQLNGNPTTPSATQQFNIVGVMKRGVVYTDQFNAAADWASYNGTTTIKIGSTGQFQIGGTGATVTNAAVEYVPTSDIPFLGIRFATV